MENREGNETKESKPLVGPESQRNLRTTGRDSVVAGNGNALSSKRAVVIYIGLFLAGWISNEILLSFTSRPNNPAGVLTVLNTNMNTNVPEQIVLREKGDEAIGTINVDLAYVDEDNGVAIENELSHHVLHSHTYSNCPLIMAKFSQYELGNEGPFKSDIDRLTNSMDRAKMALDFSNDNHAYDKVVTALENGAFDDRKIVLDGDSLTRQLFISLGCMAWAAGYVDEYDYEHDVHTGGTNTIMNNAHYEASSKYFGMGTVHLKGGGQIYYIGNPTKEKIEVITDSMVKKACSSSLTTTSNSTDVNGISPSEDKTSQLSYEARYHWDMHDTLPMSTNDVLVLAAGHHQERKKYISAYAKMYQCMNNATTNDTHTFDTWPHMMYQLSSVESFWTDTGKHGDDIIEGSNWMTCQSSPKTSPHRTEERETLSSLVDFIGDRIDLENLGELHVWHGDCLHWLQPGIPDLYAAEVADYLLSSSKQEV